MEILLRVIAVVFALVGLAYFFLSLARTAIINRPSKDPILGVARSLTHMLILGIRRDRNFAGNQQRLLAWYMPIFIMALIITWFLLALVSFAALYWAFGAETTLRGALIASGSALTTLGFATPSSLHGQVQGSAWDRFAATRSMYEQALRYISAQTLTQDYIEFLTTATE